MGFLERYQAAKKRERRKRKISVQLKKLIYNIREQERDCCGQKIKYFLKEHHQISLGTTTIYKVLAQKYQLRTKWKKNQVRGPVPCAEEAREVIQMDTVDFGEIFAFTAVDIFSKEANVLLRPSLTGRDGLVFLGRGENSYFVNIRLPVSVMKTDSSNIPVREPSAV